MTSINFKAACFDLNGTLIDTGPSHRAAERATVRAFGFDDLTADHPVTFGTGVIPGAQLVAEHLRHRQRRRSTGRIPAPVEADSRRGYRPAAGCRIDRPQSGGAGTLVALVTSGERGYADEFLRISGLAEVFVCSVTLEDVVKLKPNP